LLVYYILETLDARKLKYKITYHIVSTNDVNVVLKHQCNLY